MDIGRGCGLWIVDWIKAKADTDMDVDVNWTRSEDINYSCAHWADVALHSSMKVKFYSRTLPSYLTSASRDY